MTALTDATLYAPLKTTLVLTNGSGNPAFTRATTKTVEDNEGIVKTLKSGAVGLAGARHVRNWLSHTDDLANADWELGATTTLTPGITDPDLGSSAYQLDFPSVVGDCLKQTITYDPYGLVGKTIVLSIYIKADSAGTIRFIEGNSGVPDSTQNVTTSWTRIETSGAYPGAGYLQFYIGRTSAGMLNKIYVWHPQLEDVTGQAIQTAGEYVSVGVLSAPYHGGGADGVKYFDTDSSGVTIPDATMLGAQLDYASKTNSMLWCRDLTNAVWVKTNCTAAKTQTGVDGLANACSLLTATSADATCLQTITTAAVAACTGWKVKRSVGTGLIYITRDNGSNWTDITSLINSGTFTLTGIENTSVLDPVVGFKIATSGDAIIVDSGRNHSGTELCEDIFTTTAAVTRNAEVLTYQTASNFSDTAGTILATIKRDNWGNGNGSAVGKASFGLLTSSANSGVQAADGTNTVSGAAGTPTGQRRIGARWTGSSLQSFYEDEYGAIGSYDGSFNLSTIAVMPGTQGYIRDLAIFNTSLADTDMPWYVAPIVVTATPAYGGGGSLPYSKTNKVPRPMATVMPNDDDEVLVVIQLFMESGCQ